MTYEEILRRACERAGLKKQRDGLWVYRFGWAGCRTIHTSDPALESYVADLLSNVDTTIYREALVRLPCITAWKAPPRTRILAAMVALGELTLEQAREVGDGE